MTAVASFVGADVCFIHAVHVQLNRTDLGWSGGLKGPFMWSLSGGGGDWVGELGFHRFKGLPSFPLALHWLIDQ